jgi:Ca-activated chloride channel family protein
MDITFLNAQFLWSLFLIPLMIALHFFLMKYTRRRALLFANFEAMKRVTGSMVLSKNITLLVTRVLVLLFFILSAAGVVIWTKGVGADYNYVVSVDASSSMLANDVDPNRLEVAKETAKEFLNSLNPEAKAGYVTFSGVTRIESTLTSDKKAINDALDATKVSSTGGTDITSAIITSANILMTEKDKSMSIIILTDGRHTVGSPIDEGINYAAQNRVAVHTIGIATEKGGSFELTQLLSTLDEETLKRISDNTGGKYFRAGSREEMKAAFAEIATLSEQNTPHQLRLVFLLIGLGFLLLEWTLLSTRFRTLP